VILEVVYYGVPEPDFGPQKFLAIGFIPSLKLVAVEQTTELIT
jgi:hypothetical protein